MLKTAKNQNKHLLVEIINGTQVADDEYFNTIVFAHEKVSRIIPENYILLKVNLKTDKNIKRYAKYNVHKYPTFLFLDGDDNIMYKLAGKVEPNIFLDASNFGINPDNNMHLWKRMIDENPDAESGILFNYAKGLYYGGDNYELYKEKYFKNVGANYAHDMNGIEAVLLFTEDMNDPRFTIFMEDYSAIGPGNLNPRFVNKKINEIISISIILSVSANKKIVLDDTISSTCRTFHIDDPMVVMSIVKMKYYKQIEKNQDNYFRALTEYLMTSNGLLYNYELHSYIKELTNDCNNQEFLMMAITQLNELISIDNKIDYQPTMIDISIKLHNFSEANHALEVLKSFNIEAKKYSEAELNAMAEKINKAHLEYKEAQPKREVKKENNVIHKAKK